MSDLRSLLIDIARAGGGRVRLGASEWKPSGLPAPTGPAVRPTTRRSLLEEPIRKLPSWPRIEPTPDEQCIHGRVGICPDCTRDAF